MSKQKQTDAVMVRIPKDLAARIDEAAEAAGGVPRERWVRRALEKLLVPDVRTVTREGVRIVDLDVDPVESPTARKLKADYDAQPERQSARPKRPSRPEPELPAAVKRDANQEYARMMAERQARLEKGR